MKNTPKIAEKRIDLPLFILSGSSKENKNMKPPMTKINAATGKTIFFKKKSIMFLINKKKWQSWQAGSSGPPQGTKPFASLKKGIKIKKVKKILKKIFTLFNTQDRFYCRN